MNRLSAVVALLGLGLIAATGSVKAEANSVREVFMVELAVFTCPASKETNTKLDAIEREVGANFVFAPISEGSVSPAVKAWYALRDEVNSERVRRMLFSLMQDVRMETPSDKDVAEWLGITAEVSVPAKDVEIKMHSVAVGKAVNRAVHLTKKAGVRHVPAFVYVSGQDVLAVVERGDMITDCP